MKFNNGLQWVACVAEAVADLGWITELRAFIKEAAMRITQAFTSADDGRVISEMEISPDQATSIPVAGDHVQWVVKDKVYAGDVKSRFISYSAPNNIGLERAYEVNMRAVLSVELES